MRVVHLYHSGILLETDKVQLFIDSFKDIEHLIDENKRTYIIASHGHGDHWNPDYEAYAEKIEKYILSDDIETRLNDIMFMKPYGSYRIGGFEISTYGSTDRGVSMVVEIDGKTIYHSGDLNWWHWENDSLAVQKKEEEEYKTELGRFNFKRFDLAFVPADPRLKSAYLYAAKYFIETFEVKKLVPIHFGDQFDITYSLSEALSGSETEIIKIPSTQFEFEL